MNMTKTFAQALREAIIEAIEEVGLENFKRGSSWFMSNRSKVKSKGSTKPTESV